MERFDFKGFQTCNVGHFEGFRHFVDHFCKIHKMSTRIMEISNDLNAKQHEHNGQSRTTKALETHNITFFRLL